MRFCIDRRVIGTERSLIVDHASLNCEWSDRVPLDAWHLNGKLKTGALCLDSMLRLRGIEVSLLPEQRYMQMIKQLSPALLSAGDVPWSKVMPPAKHASFVRKLANSVAVSIDQDTLNYLMNAWAIGGYLLASLVPATIDLSRLLVLLAREKSDSNAAALRSFMPCSGTECVPVEYNRFATSTGRLIVSAGPQILTVRKDCRSVLRPSRPGGKICAIDFSSLEARIVLTQARRSCDEPDLYGMIAGQLFGDAVTRSQVKIATLSLLFGAGRRMVAECLKTDGPDVDVFIARIAEYFQFEQLGARLSAEWRERGYIRNAFGRPLRLDGKNPTQCLLTSHFAQSTGVDVSLIGFNELVRKMGDIARPLFVLHDALIVDVAPGAYDDVVKMNAVVVADCRYPLHVEVISE